MQQEKSKELKRSAILQAAAKLFAERRFDEVKLDEIAASVGIGKGTLYLYFKNKEDIFAQIAIDGIDEMTTRILSIAAMKSLYKERLFLFANEFTTFLAKRHGVTLMMNQVESDPVDKTFRKHHGRMIEAIHELLQKGMDEGALRDDFKVAELRCFLVGPILLKVRRAARVGEIIELNALLELFWAGAEAKKKEHHD